MAENMPPSHASGEGPDPTPLLRRFQLELADVERHQLLPEHIIHARELVDLDVTHLPTRPGIRPFFSFLYTLNLEKLAQKLNDLLTPCVEGYALQLRRSGAAAISQTFRW